MTFPRKMNHVLALLPMLAAVPAHAHGPYDGLVNRSGALCCDQRDCRPSAACVLPDGRPGVVYDGACLGYAGVNILPSPDGRTHACKVPSEQQPRCVLLPGEA